MLLMHEIFWRDTNLLGVLGFKIILQLLCPPSENAADLPVIWAILVFVLTHAGVVRV